MPFALRCICHRDAVASVAAAVNGDRGAGDAVRKVRHCSASSHSDKSAALHLPDTLASPDTYLGVEDQRDDDVVRAARVATPWSHDAVKSECRRCPSHDSIAPVHRGPGSALELVILGAGPAYSDVPGSFGSSYLVRLGDAALLLDLGQGCFPALAALHEPSLLSGVFISHLHPDHFIDLMPLRHCLCRVEATHDKPIIVMAPDGLDQRLDAVYDQPGRSAAAFEQQPLTTGARPLGPFGLEVQAVRHYGESFAVRVETMESGGPGLVYTGDIADPDDVRQLIREGDLLLSEATLGPGPVTGDVPHLDGPTAGKLAADARAGHVVTTHVRMGPRPERDHRFGEGPIRRCRLVGASRGALHRLSDGTPLISLSGVDRDSDKRPVGRSRPRPGGEVPRSRSDRRPSSNAYGRHSRWVGSTGSARRRSR